VLDVVDIPCSPSTSDVNAATCIITIKAPGFALVFLNTEDELAALGQASSTFTTSAWTKMHNTATVDLQVLETSNGHSEKDRGRFRSTSKGGIRNDAMRSVERVGSAVVFGGFVIGIFLVM